MKKVFFYSLLVTFLSSCIGEDIIDDTQNMNERLSILSDMTSSDSLFVGDSLQLTAEFYDILGQVISSTKIWESSKPLVATVNQEGQVIALSEGVSNITVSSNGLMDERLLVVRQLERIEIVTVAQATVFVGDSIQLTADYYNKNGILEMTSVNWSIDNRTLANLKENGRQATLIGNAAGAVKVRVEANGVEKELNVTVIDDTNAVASVTIQTSVTSLMVGETTQFMAEAKNINGTVLSNKSIQYNTSDNSVLTIDNMGLATSVAPGSATVIATSENAVSNGISVLVSQAVTTSRTGAFSGSGGYTVNGNVTMEVVNGSLQLNFTNFSSSNGPGLYIYLGNTNNSGISIEALNRRNGNFTISLPSSITIDDYNFVLIWCQPFGLTFGSAQLN